MYDELNGTMVSGYEFIDILRLFCPSEFWVGFDPKEEEFVIEDKADDDEITADNKVESFERIF
ncbi:hypothetical protein Smp_134680 [Schistosoma mansoni]|uniref:hypothetical protein n=1 Tax=Schistosoma mansoni TaxID=6183 RepID=UPI0001A642F7|nr:hypothetical protein Smp_134680 [Schistosoma mansoni]|eukprot:XP_018650153.1 hypothetical protein Smp_134680 [Schistosoma mansoni]